MSQHEPLPVVIREACAEDVPALVGLLGELFQFEHEFSPDPAAQKRGVEAILKDEQVGMIHVAEYDGEVVGMVNLLWTVSTALGGPVAWLEDLVVTEKMRGKGVGTRLVQVAMQACENRGCKRITLLTDHDNLHAKQLYADAGFEISSMHYLKRSL